jgi:hypothetical protein
MWFVLQADSACFTLCAMKSSRRSRLHLFSEASLLYPLACTPGFEYYTYTYLRAGEQLVISIT